MDEKTRLQKAAVVESQLVLENSRLSSFLEQHGTEAKHWAEDVVDLPMDEDSDADESSDVSSTVRLSKRPRSVLGSHERLFEEAKQASNTVEYDDFGLHHPTSDSHDARKHSGESSDEEEGKDTITYSYVKCSLTFLHTIPTRKSSYRMTMGKKFCNQ